jgi:hypothetical protein
VQGHFTTNPKKYICTTTYSRQKYASSTAHCAWTLTVSRCTVAYCRCLEDPCRCSPRLPACLLAQTCSASKTDPAPARSGVPPPLTLTRHKQRKIRWISVFQISISKKKLTRYVGTALLVCLVCLKPTEIFRQRFFKVAPYFLRFST